MTTLPATAEPGTAPTCDVRPRRADAQRNRDRIVEAARASVAELGGDIVLEEVARRAGVGIGTLYRHFPTRQALLEAAFLDEAEELTGRARELATVPASIDVLVEWLRLQMDLGSHGHSMGAAVMAAKQIEGSELQVTCAAMREAGAELLRRAQDAGEVRRDVEMTDLVRLVHGIVLANASSPDPQRSARMFDVVIAGVRL